MDFTGLSADVTLSSVYEEWSLDAVTGAGLYLIDPVDVTAS